MQLGLMGMENLETVIRFLKEKRRLFKIKTCFLAPQQLGLMGMEALETVIGYWEDALAAYNPTGTLYTVYLKMCPAESNYCHRIGRFV